MKKLLICAASLVLLAASCNSLRENSPAQYGEISVVLGEPDVEVIAKSAQTLLPTDPSASEYMIRIYDQDNQFRQGQKYSEFECQPLALGSYYVTAENCSADEAEAGNGKMRIYGKSDPVVISADILNPTATVSCYVQNAKVTVAFDAGLYDASGACHFDDLKVELSRETPARTLTVSESDGETDTWFNPGTVKYQISGTYNGKAVSKGGELTLEARNHFRIVVKVNMEKGEIFVPEVTDVTFSGPGETEDGEHNVSGDFNPYQ